MIKIKSEILTYEFKHHINVIGGYASLGDNSGTFKTALFEYLRTANNNRQIECNLRLVLLDLTTSLYELRFDNSACYTHKLLDLPNSMPAISYHVSIFRV